MKIKELMEELKKYDENMEVVCYNIQEDLDHPSLSVIKVTKAPKSDYMYHDVNGIDMLLL